MGLFVVLELFTNLVLETALYAGAAGVVAGGTARVAGVLDVLWGPLGLLMGDTADGVPRRARQARAGTRNSFGMMMADPRSCSRIWLLHSVAGSRSERGGDLIERHIKTHVAALCLRRTAAAGAQLCGARRIERRFAGPKKRPSSMRRESCCPMRRIRSGAWTQEPRRSA